MNIEELTETLDDFIAQRLSIAIDRYKRIDLDYQEIECYLYKYQDKLDEILNSMEETHKVFLIEYMGKKYYEALCMNEYLYKEGYRDCIKLLKELKLFT